jgi:hypothetical protein
MDGTVGVGAGLQCVAVVEKDTGKDVMLTWCYPGLSPLELEGVIVSQAEPFLVSNCCDCCDCDAPNCLCAVLLLLMLVVTVAVHALKATGRSLVCCCRKAHTLRFCRASTLCPSPVRRYRCG